MRLYLGNLKNKKAYRCNATVGEWKHRYVVETDDYDNIQGAYQVGHLYKIDLQRLDRVKHGLVSKVTLDNEEVPVILKYEKYEKNYMTNNSLKLDDFETYHRLNNFDDQFNRFKNEKGYKKSNNREIK